jgi:hypothetical protein
MRERRKRARHDRAPGRVRLVPAGSLSSSLTTIEAQWMLLPRDPVSIADVIRQAADCLQISSTANLQLRLDGALLKPDQPADLVRDGDSLTVLQISKSKRRGEDPRTSDIRHADSDVASSSSSDESVSSKSSSSSSSSASASSSSSTASSPLSSSPENQADKSERSLRAPSGVNGDADATGKHGINSVEKGSLAATGTKRKISQARRKSRNRRNRLREKRRKHKQPRTVEDEGERATSAGLAKDPLEPNQRNDVEHATCTPPPKDQPVSQLKGNVVSNISTPSEFKDVPVEPNLVSRGGDKVRRETAPRDAQVDRASTKLFADGEATSAPTVSSFGDDQPAGSGLKGNIFVQTSVGVEAIGKQPLPKSPAPPEPAQIRTLGSTALPRTNSHSSAPPVANQGRVGSISGVLERLKRMEPVLENLDSSRPEKLVVNGPGKRKPAHHSLRANAKGLRQTDHRFRTELQTNVSVILPAPHQIQAENGDSHGSNVTENGYGENVITTDFISELKRNLGNLGLTQVQCGLRLVSLGHDGCPHLSEWIAVIVKPDASSESILIHRAASRKAADIIIAAGGQHLDLHPPDFPMAIDVSALHGLLVYKPSPSASVSLSQVPEKQAEPSVSNVAVWQSRAEGNADRAGRSHLASSFAPASSSEQALEAQAERGFQQHTTGELSKLGGSSQILEQTGRPISSAPVSQARATRESVTCSVRPEDPKVHNPNEECTLVAGIAKVMAIFSARLEQFGSNT